MSEATERRRRDNLETFANWAREAATIIAAAGAAYMGIRVDLARNQVDIENLRTTAARIESQVEKLRETNYQIQIQAGANHAQGAKNEAK